MISILKFSDSDFSERFRRIEERADEIPAGIEATVKDIIAAVRQRGDEAVFELTARFDRLQLSADSIEVTREEIAAARAAIDPRSLAVLELAARRIAAYHQKQKQQTWLSTEEDDVLLGQMVTPLERVGIYVPGGKAAYPSSVLMNAIPAKVAGVAEIIMTVPMPGGEANPYVLAAAAIAGVDRIFRIGGAQAVAALAYGTASVPRVDKITGPGNIYVATAKQLVFGQVDIDMIAGPSEILIINDGSGDAEHLAADLLSQAEHDELASSVLITTDEGMARAVAEALESQLKVLSREEIARKSIEQYGAIIVAGTLDEAIAFSNRIAPEHLELAVDNPFEILSRIHHAGAIFMGHHTPEAAGDYLAGPNHTLPTGGTYSERTHAPMAEFTEIAQVEDFDLGDPADWDFAGAAEAARNAHPRNVTMGGYFGPYVDLWSLFGEERALLNIGLRPWLIEAVLDRVMDYRLRQHRMLFAAAAEWLDLAQTADDFGAQNGLVMSPAAIRSLFWPHYRRVIALAHEFGLKVYHHDDGGIGEIVPDLVEMGVEVLNPIQYRCHNMDREWLKREFGDALCFHAAIDNQYVLPFGTPEDVRREVRENIRLLASDGTGYICGPCHNIQSGTPLENVLALYDEIRRAGG